MSDSRRFKRAFVFCVKSSEGLKEAGPPFGWEIAMAGRNCSFPLLQRCASIFQSTNAPALETTSPASQISAKRKDMSESRHARRPRGAKPGEEASPKRKTVYSEIQERGKGRS